MKSFSSLIQKLGTSTKTNDRLDALQHYFDTAPDSDKVWVIALFSGRRPRSIVKTAWLRQWCMEISDTTPWLFEECYHTVGDLAETIALLLPAPDLHTNIQEQTLTDYLTSLTHLEQASESEKKYFVTTCWSQMNKDEKFVFNKLITGGFRIGVSQTTIVNALSRSSGISTSAIAHAISGNWDPSVIQYDELITTEAGKADISRPYPFYLSYALDISFAELGEPAFWQAEWKWDGIRGQIIKRAGELFVWSRGEELVTDKFPEFYPLKALLPEGIVLDGEIISMQHGLQPGTLQPLPFATMQTRIGRKKISKKQLEESPVSFIIYDILEFEGQDCRTWPLTKRRALLERVMNEQSIPFVYLSPTIAFDEWGELAIIRQQSRERKTEGLMLKRKSSAYETGRKRGDWWKWKIDQLTIDAVMIYAQKGHGRRSNLYTDYTFAVKDGDQLVPFAKAYSGLTDKEFAQVDAFVKRNAIEKFGPVRTVKPELVFEIAFEGIAASNRHKSGIAVRFPRISRWRKDKKTDEINTVQDLQELLKMVGAK